MSKPKPPLIGIGWMVPSEKGVFFNLTLSKDKVDMLKADAHGNIHITTAQLMTPDLITTHTHVVYEDLHKVDRQKKKDENRLASQA